MRHLLNVIIAAVTVCDISFGSTSRAFSRSGWFPLTEPDSRAWLWTNAGDPRLRVQDPDDGYVELTVRRDTPIASRLRIRSVQRPTKWPAGESFCTSMLQAAIRQMYDVHHELSVATLKEMYVDIDADPYETACKCYIRAMASMGFTHASRHAVLGPSEMIPMDEEGVVRFCAREKRWHIFATIQGGAVGRPHLPPVDAFAAERLASVDFVVDTVREHTT